MSRTDARADARAVSPLRRAANFSGKTRALQAGAALVCIAVLGIRFAEPVIDGDLFWHLKYAEQMIARGTLIPDHTLYSWTPTSNAMIYCAWLAELVLYHLHQLGGLPILFVARYVVIAAASTLLLIHARSLGVADRLPAWAIAFLSISASVAGTHIKPEIFSFLGFHLIVFAYCRARAANSTGAAARNWFLAIPLAVLIWVNSHGGFILAAPFFIATFVGELLTRRFAPDRALSPISLKWMLAAWGLSGLAVFVTPYGWRYPWQLVVDYVLRATPRPDESWNVAYISILSPYGSTELFTHGILLVFAIVLLVVFAGLRMIRVDWGLLIAGVCYVPLYLLYGRTTFYFSVVFGYLALELFKAGVERNTTQISRQLPNSVAAALILAAGTTTLHAALTPANRGGWIGFGIGRVNPVTEAEFLAASKIGPRLYNLFDSGGYLLWRLHPSYLVMVDQRSFPYLGWFGAQYRFANGDIFDEFLKTYPADAAVIDLARTATWSNFLRSPDWKLAYYGPTAAVFVHRSVPDQRLAQGVVPDRFDRMLNGWTALGVFDFATVVGDYPTAWKALEQLEGGLRRHIGAERFEQARAVREGHRALAIGRYDEAQQMFEHAFKRPTQGWREPVILKLLEARAAAVRAGNAAEIARHESVLRELALRQPD